MLEPDLIDLVKKWLETENLDLIWTVARDGEGSAFLHLETGQANAPRPHFIMNQGHFRLCCGLGSKEEIDAFDLNFFPKIKAALNFESEAIGLGKNIPGTEQKTQK